ncbi:MAG: poly(3-hydroxyalkanoate) depolymerase, partial [Sporichthyaceae bacterium]
MLEVGRALQVSHWPGAHGQVPLLLCSGIGACAALFDPLIEVLDPRRPLITFNAPGLAGSPEARGPDAMAGLGRRVGRRVGRLGGWRGDVVGLCWGGVLA